MACKLLFIGIDAMSPALVERWTASGDMPVLAGLRERGFSATVDNPPGFLSSMSLWPTFFTGTSPASHGFGAYRQIVPGTYETRVLGPADVGNEPVWERLSRAGKRVAVIDIPSARLPETLNGIQVNEWTTHDVLEGLKTYPPGLADDILAEYGPDPVGSCDRGSRAPGDIAAFTDGLRRRILLRERFARRLLEGEDWDLFMIGLSESHCVGHQCWHLHDEGHPAFDPGHTEDPVKAVYRATDRTVGTLMAAAPAAVVCVYSCQGMAASFDANAGLDDILRRLEGGPATASGVAARLVPLLRRIVPGRFHGMLNRPALWWKNRVNRSDWPARKYFTLPSSYAGCGCIRFNVVGREPAGRIAAGPHLEAETARLTGQLLSLRNAANGEAVVRQVRTAHDALGGHVPADFPDLLVEWVDTAPIPSVVSSEFAGEVRVSASHRSGNHRSDGLFIAAGDRIEPRRSPSPVQVTDLAPTVAAWLGVEAFGHGDPLPQVRGAAVP